MPINKALANGKWWWAYLDDSGVIHVKKYTDDAIIVRTEQLPFCKGIFDPFKAENKHQAQLMIAKWLDEQSYHQTSRTQ